MQPTRSGARLMPDVRQRLLGYKPIGAAETGALDFPYRDLQAVAYSLADPRDLWHAGPASSQENTHQRHRLLAGGPMVSNSRHRGGFLARAGFGVLIIGLVACSQRQVVQGQCRPLNGADVCVWGESSGNTLVAFGATVPVGSVENAPADAPMVWPPVAVATIPLPEAVSAATGFKVLTLYWEPHGHPPGPYLVPHFDFHFNTISADEVSAIDCADSTKPGRLPTAYELPDVTTPQLGTLLGLCVPKMGMHALLGAELHAATPFQKTMIVGYYRGRPIFVEAMITRATLLERRSFLLTIPDVPDRPANVRYPTRFQADYDSTTQAYKFVFSDLTAAGAP